MSGGISATGGLVNKLLPAQLKLLLEPTQDRRMHLRDATLGQIERQADLLHGQFFIVVQNQDEPFGPGQSARDQLLEILLVDFL